MLCPSRKILRITSRRIVPAGFLNQIGLCLRFSLRLLRVSGLLPKLVGPAFRTPSFLPKLKRPLTNAMFIKLVVLSHNFLHFRYFRMVYIGVR